MAKQGMKRPVRNEHQSKTHKKNTLPPVPELQGKEKSGKKSVEADMG